MSCLFRNVNGIRDMAITRHLYIDESGFDPHLDMESIGKNFNKVTPDESVTTYQLEVCFVRSRIAHHLNALMNRPEAWSPSNVEIKRHSDEC